MSDNDKSTRYIVGILLSFFAMLLAIYDKEGWGWFLFGAVLCMTTSISRH